MTEQSANYHDTGYKELFSYPEMVQQLIEGFAPKALAELLDFSTLKQHTGHYITPVFDVKAEDVVWSVQAQLDEDQKIEIYLYILLEFQSTVDHAMPLRFMHYIANFYSHLYKNKKLKPSEPLPPVFPIVLYNGNPRWTAKTNMAEMIHPVPAILKPYQPQLSYYLVDEGRYTEAQLEQIDTPMSAVFSLENATDDQKMVQAILRTIKIIQLQQGERRETINKVLTHWLKRHLQRLGLGINIEDSIEGLTEETSMLAENMENWKQSLMSQSKQEGIQEGIEKGLQKGLQKGKQEGRLEGKRESARTLIRVRFGESALVQYEEKITQASEAVLDHIHQSIFSVQQVEDLFKAL